MTEADNPHMPLDDSGLPKQPERVQFGRRLGAYLIDWVFIAILAGLLMLFAQEPLTDLAREGLKSQITAEELREFQKLEDQLGFNFLGAMIKSAAYSYAMSFVWVLYFMLEIFIGAALGKLILGIKIGDEEGYPASIGQLFFRYMLKMTPSFIGIVAALAPGQLINLLSSFAGTAFLVSCFWALNKARQALHDIWPHTAIYWRKDLQRPN